MEVYSWYLAAFASVDLILIRHVARRRQNSGHENLVQDVTDEHNKPDSTSMYEETRRHSLRCEIPVMTFTTAISLDAAHFRTTYFSVYALVLASDWLQGPYIYAIYHDMHRLSSATITALFATGFISAGVSASFAGHLADIYGHKKACIVFCAVSVGSCLSVVHIMPLSVLFIGRILGGLGSTLLYSVFDTYMVTKHKLNGLEPALPLSDMFSHSVLLSGLVALCSGVAGECLVLIMQSLSAPFWLAILCLGFASVGIVLTWDDNFSRVESVLGSPVTDLDENAGKLGAKAVISPRAGSYTEKSRIYVLVVITTIFEGSMYLFVFNWTPALSMAHRSALSPSAGEAADMPDKDVEALPLGLIFSCFMCAMILGSQTFSMQTFRHHERDSDWSLSMVNTLAIASLALIVPAVLRQERTIFWSFLVFETVVGFYYPTMNKLKSVLVPDATRARVYAWMRLPLNFFVVMALAVTRDGNDVIRSTMFLTLGVLLLMAALVAKMHLP